MISAAHCFVDKNGDYPPNPSWNELTVALGLSDVSNINLSEILPIQKRKIKTVHFHESYEYPAVYNDIAIVELDSPVILGPQVEPICLPDGIDPDPDSMSGNSATLVGYGPKDDSTRVNQLKHKIYKQPSCDVLYNPENAGINYLLRHRIQITLPEKFQDSLICAGDRYNSDKGTCSGDSGAPLIVDEFDYETFEVKFKLIAVLHGGIVSCDNSLYPAIYNKVAAPKMYDWIIKKLSGKSIYK